MDRQKHNESIKAQFAQQAASYTSIKAHAEALDTLVQLSNISKADTVLDVACGSGIVACEFAKHASHVTGVDITENMLAQARELQAKHRLHNIDWVLDDVVPLRFNTGQFSIVVSRFSFHHFMDGEKVLDEMIRVCKPGGTVMVIDVALPTEKLTAYDEMEKLRDPSHVGALSTDKFHSLFFNNSKLSNCQSTGYKMVIELETQLNASFPNPGDKEKLRTIITSDVGKDDLGVNVTRMDGQYQLYYPIYIYTGQKV